jgi:hypothetical protein
MSRARLPAQGWMWMLGTLNRAISWATGLGAITHITGPTDQSLKIVSGSSQLMELGEATTTSLWVNSAGMIALDNKTVKLGTSSDAALDWSTAQATANCPVIASGAGTAAQGYPVVFTALANANKDHDHAAGSNPTIFVHSATDPDSANTEYIGLLHDVTDAVITSGKGYVKHTLTTPAQSYYPGGVISINTGSQATTGTSEETLMSFSLPASTLNVDGRGVRITAWGVTAANGNAKTYGLYFGATALTNAPGITDNNHRWRIDAIVFRTAAATQEGITTRSSSTSDSAGGGTTRNVRTTPGETLSGAVTIALKATTATSAGDVTCEGLLVEVLP